MKKGKGHLWRTNTFLGLLPKNEKHNNKHVPGVGTEARSIISPPMLLLCFSCPNEVFIPLHVVQLLCQTLGKKWSILKNTYSKRRRK